MHTDTSTIKTHNNALSHNKSGTTKIANGGKALNLTLTANERKNKQRKEDQGSTRNTRTCSSNSLDKAGSTSKIPVPKSSGSKYAAPKQTTT